MKLRHPDVFDDHRPPHFHVITRKNERINLVTETLAILAGDGRLVRYGRGVRLGTQEPSGRALTLAGVFGGRVMNGTKAIRIASVKHAREYKLRLRWVSGKTMTVDLSEPVHRLKCMRPLRDEADFARAAKGEGGHSIVWPGEIDMGADRLWEMSLEQNGHLDAVGFIR